MTRPRSGGARRAKGGKCDTSEFCEGELYVVFCDLRSSTELLKRFGAHEFRLLQQFFFRSSYQHVINGCGKFESFLGDGFMFYVNAQNNLPQSALAVSKIIRNIVHDTSQQDTTKFMRDRDIRLGLRFGVAYGKVVIINSVSQMLRGRRVDEAKKTDLAVPNLKNRAATSAGQLSTPLLTGEAVNMAARLEHATTADFLDALRTRKRLMAPFLDLVGSEEALAQSELEAELTTIRKQALDVYNLQSHRFQIRATPVFGKDLIDASVSLAWKTTPLFVKGISEAMDVQFVSGMNEDELFKRV